MELRSETVIFDVQQVTIFETEGINYKIRDTNLIDKGCGMHETPEIIGVTFDAT